MDRKSSSQSVSKSQTREVKVKSTQTHNARQPEKQRTQWTPNREADLRLAHKMELRLLKYQFNLLLRSRDIIREERDLLEAERDRLLTEKAENWPLRRPSKDSEKGIEVTAEEVELLETYGDLQRGFEAIKSVWDIRLQQDMTVRLTGLMELVRGLAKEVEDAEAEAARGVVARRVAWEIYDMFAALDVEGF